MLLRTGACPSLSSIFVRCTIKLHDANQRPHHQPEEQLASVTKVSKHLPPPLEINISGLQIYFDAVLNLNFKHTSFFVQKNHIEHIVLQLALFSDNLEIFWCTQVKKEI